MVEEGTRETTGRSSSNAAGGTTPGGGGRGGRGRGRGGRGRGGRGRSGGRGRGGRGRGDGGGGRGGSGDDNKNEGAAAAAAAGNNTKSTDNDPSTGTTKAASTSNNNSSHPDSSSGGSGGRGRGGRGRGRGGRGGRGRGGRGRGRGRGRSNNSHRNRSTSYGSSNDGGDENHNNDGFPPFPSESSTEAGTPKNNNENQEFNLQDVLSFPEQKQLSSFSSPEESRLGRFLSPEQTDPSSGSDTKQPVSKSADSVDQAMGTGDRNSSQPRSGRGGHSSSSSNSRSNKKPGKGGIPIILSRNSNNNDAGGINFAGSSSQAHSQQSGGHSGAEVDYDSEAHKLSESLAAAALEDSFDAGTYEEEKKELSAVDEPSSSVGVPDSSSSKSTTGLPPKGKPNKNKKKPKPKKKKKGEADETPLAEEAPAPAAEVTTTDALQSLPAQEVSITATTKVQIRRSESSVSMENMETDVMLTSKIIPGSKQKKGKSKGKKKALSRDDAANQRAAKHFNKSVRECVQRGDADGIREIIHNKSNHNFALDKNVLETVMKAFVVAAMFEEGLYCLRNCTLPGTLSTAQTERILTCMPQNLRNSSSYTAADMINALCIATDFDKPTSRTYFIRIVRGISLEFLEEVMSARDRICSAPCERLVRSATCVVDSRFKRGKKPNELIVVPGEQLGIFVPDSMENRGIQTGDAVSILPYAGPYPMSAESLDRNMIEATVTNTNPMVLRFNEKLHISVYNTLTEQIEGNVYRIDKLANRMGFNRQLAAAIAMTSPVVDNKVRDTKRPSSQLIKAITAMDENIGKNMMEAGNNRMGGMTSTAAICNQSVPWNYEEELDGEHDDHSIRESSRLALEKHRLLDGLNESQSHAVQGAVTNRLTLVQGPPGTGKTAVAIRILDHWARLAKAESRNGEIPSPILATSDSNIAVDNLVEGCASIGLSVVRLGRPESIRPELLKFCIDRPPSSYSSGGRDREGTGTAMSYKERMKSLKRAQVVCCTCIGSGGDILDSMTFDRILVDEATQATEPAILVPLMRGCRQLVLVGDHCQLPPTVLSTRAEEEGHGVPLFSRMVACGVPPFMLDTQYRMHPSIAMFPSDLFYGGKLLNGVSAPERRPLAGFEWPREEFPVAFIPVRGNELDDGVSKMNNEEAVCACEVVEQLLHGGQCRPSDIAVVTPYAAQAKLIRRMTRQLTQGQEYIEVSSVDGFQGREKEAVIFSAVRSNDYGAIGFTSDWRRVNVSFTRARRALIVIGNDVTLRRGDPETWAPWLGWAEAHGLNIENPGVPRGRYDPEVLQRVRGGTTAAEMLKDVLARQKAQSDAAAKQLEKAEKNAVGHIIGKEDDEEADGEGSDKVGNGLTLEEDLARLANTDGNWDDSDDEDDGGGIHRSVSRTTLSSAGRTDSGTENDSETVDVWDL